MNNTEELNHLIKSSGIAKKKIAEFAGVVPSTVARWCTGAAPIPPLVLEKLRRINRAVNE